MLIGNFFSISQIQTHQGSILAVIEINPTHQIFEGHFPGQPVVPGVCMLQMVKEILESVLKMQLMLTHADQIKFLSMIDPRKTTKIKAEIRFDLSSVSEIPVNASLNNEGVVYMKMKAAFNQII
ncbi:MAG: 3-hydroxyacyl-ACP dehydratase [Chitinophagales bacterium]